jgi:RHS repeat-associated protein
MPEIPLLRWDYADRLHATARQAGRHGEPGLRETTYYVYDASGQRARKVTKRPGVTGPAARKSERIYVGAFEVFREYGPDGAVTLERETLNVFDDTHRLALAETRTTGMDRGSGELIRYQLANHLNSSVLELDQDARVISYEEYYPYGSTSYQAVRGGTEAPKRFRYTGRERDTETGLYYHGARYYIPWLARWTSCDPAGLADGTNIYAYVRGNPVRLADPTGHQGDEPAKKDDPGSTPAAAVLPDVPHYELTRPAFLGPDPAGDAGSPSVAGIADRPDKPEPTAQDRGGRGGSTMNMEYLTNGNTAGGATENNATELILGGGLNIPGRGGATGTGTLLLSGRFGLFRGAEGGILVGGGATLAGPPGTGSPPQLVLGTFHAANQAGNAGIFAQAGAQRDPATGAYTYAGGFDLAVTKTAGAHDSVQIYPNVIFTTAGTGQVANADVKTYSSVTALTGFQDTPARLNDKGKWVPGLNTGGAEASITGNLGYPAAGHPAADPAARTSATATALIFYQRAFGSAAVGAALGGSYETGGGGWGAFLRVGIGLDWRPSTAPQFPSLELPVH